MLLRSPGPISPDTYSGHIRRRALCPNRLRNGMSQRSSSSCQSDILPTMVGPSKSRPPMSHRKTDLGIPCRSKSAKVVLAVLVLLSANPQTFSNHDQIGQRFGAHFSHDVAAVNLYCPFAYADLACDLLVHKAAGHERHNLALARG